jgi:hypothetical protein
LGRGFGAGKIDSKLKFFIERTDYGTGGRDTGLGVGRFFMSDNIAMIEAF